MALVGTARIILPKSVTKTILDAAEDWGVGLIVKVHAGLILNSGPCYLSFLTSLWFALMCPVRTS